MKNEYQYNRFAVSLSKKFGKAVIRNKQKRWVREIYREMKESVQEDGYDLLFLLFPGNHSFKQRKAQLYSLISKADLWDTKPGVIHG